MNNWMTRLTRRLPWLQSRAPCRPMARRWMPEVGELVAVPDDAGEEQLGCGWFDSSWELQRGLAVLEGPVIDPLGLWTLERSLAARQVRPAPGRSQAA